MGGNSPIVAGGPTHAHGMARPNAHRAVAKMDPHHKYGPVLPGQESLRGWLQRLPERHMAAATFDTRFDKPRWLTGSAAKRIARRMRLWHLYPCQAELVEVALEHRQ